MFGCHAIVSLVTTSKKTQSFGVISATDLEQQKRSPIFFFTVIWVNARMTSGFAGIGLIFGTNLELTDQIGLLLFVPPFWNINV